MQIPGVGMLKKWKLQGLIKKEVEFLGVVNWSRKNHVEFPWVLIFGLVKISKPKKECTTILQNFLEWILFSLEFTISKGKFQGFFKNVLQSSTTAPVWISFWNNPINKVSFNKCHFWKCPESVSISNKIKLKKNTYIHLYLIQNILKIY